MVKSIVIALMAATVFFYQIGYSEELDTKVIFAKKLSLAMKSWLSEEMQSNGGKLVLTDSLDGEKLELSVVELDSGDHLHPMSKTRFLSWGEFKGAKGKAVMLDIFFVLKGDDLVFDNEISIYSKGGRKRYSWDETGEYLQKLPPKTDAK
ncbi:MAG: hypothetical protein AB9Q22_13560 [Candidatus Reddybacter sp.]